MRVLGLETSCDETAAAVVETGEGLGGRVLRSNVDAERLKLIQSALAAAALGVFIMGASIAGDMTDETRIPVIVGGGQSGNPCSPHYADQLPLWHAGETVTIPWDQGDVIRTAKIKVE